MNMREMKDSGIEWIKHIPIEWESKTIRHLLISRDGGAWGEDVPDGETGTICMRIADFEYEKGCFKDSPLDSLTKRRYMDYQIKRLKLEKGDILIEKSGGGEKTPVGRSVIFDKGYFALFANFMERLRFNPSTILSEYVEYWLRTWYSCRCSPFYINQTTGIQNLNLTLMLAKERIFYPNIHEQSRIVSYLDTKCSEIDALVADIQKQIDTLEEYKRSVITEAVTKGLAPDVEMRESGIDTFDFIPKHWEVLKIKWLLRERNERSVSGEEEPLSMSQKFGIIPTSQMDIIPNMASSFVGAKITHIDDLVFNKLKAHLGVFAVSKYYGLVSPDYAVYFTSGKSIVKYLEFLFKTDNCISEFKRRSTGVGAGLTRLYTSDLFDIKVPIPPISEQMEIAKHLDCKISEINLAISEKHQQIETIEEYKKSLIFEYVTGKKEVTQ